MQLLVQVGRIWLIRAAFYLSRLLPLRDRVVLATSHKARIDGNLACLQAEMARRMPPIETVSLAHRARPGLPGMLRAALHEARAAHHLATARVFIVDDYFLPIYVIRPRRGTRIIQAGHALGPGKRWGHALAGKSFGAHPSLLSRVRIHANYDFCLLGSKAAAASYAAATLQPPDRFVTHLGIPRTDLLFGEQRRSAVSLALRRRYGIPDSRRVVLYAPTFRGASAHVASHPDDLDLTILRELLGDTHVLLVRRHPFVQTALEIDPALAGFVIDVSDHPEINELMLVSDVLVTDYSTCVYEFSLLGRPIAFFMPDHAAVERERGFFVDFATEGPGPAFNDTRTLGHYLAAQQFDLQQVARFRKKWIDVADGHSSQRVVDQLVVPALVGRRPQAQSEVGRGS